MNSLIKRRRFLQIAGVGVSAGVAGSVSALASADGRVAGEAPARRAARSLSLMDGLVALRVPADQWLTDQRFDGLLVFLRTCAGTVDELAFFTSTTHPPLPLDDIRRRAERLGRLMARVRREGMRAGINILATMGHHEENLDASLQESWPRVMDAHGRESRGSYCPRSPGFQSYVREVYIALAEARPDFIWIDDDVRLAGHMPVHYTCFCDACLEAFGVANDRSFTRESLVAAFQTGELDERLGWRRRWLDHQRASLNQLFGLIEQTVHERQRGLPLGFMTGDRFFEGYDFATWARTLGGAEGAPVRWRPGGGFYSDESLAGLAAKSHDIGRQVAQLPTEVSVIQSEIENFPYDLLRKSAETTVVEAAAHMGAGTTGTAFNVLSQRPDPLGEYEPILRRIQAMKPFYGLLRTELGRHGLSGVWPAWNRDSFIANQPDGSWPEGPGDAIAALSRSYVLGEIGLPLCYGPGGARVTVLAGSGLLAFSQEELRSMFRGGVLMDVAAWRALDRRGLSGWTGVRPGPERTRDTIEQLAEHPLNGRFVGWSRDCRQSFWRETATTLEPVSGEVKALARMIDYAGSDHGMSMSAYTNELGGRVVVMGYYPWSQMHHLAKSSQVKSVCTWLSGDRLAGVIDGFARVHVWVREVARDRLAVVVLNASLDPAVDLALRLLRGYRRIRWTGMDGQSETLRWTSKQDRSGHQVRLPTLRPWSVSLVVAEGE